MKTLVAILLLSASGFAFRAKTDVDKQAHLFLGEVTFKPAIDISGNGSEGYLQNLAIVNDSDETLTMEIVSFEFFENGKLIHENSLYAEELYQEAHQGFVYEKQGILEGYGLAPEVQKFLAGATFADSRIVGPNEVILFRKKHFNINGQPNKVIVTAIGYNENMDLITIEYAINI